MKIEKEADVLNREYKRLVKTAERQIETPLNQIFERQYQIIKELEECTGVQITLRTREDILKDIGDKK